MMWDRICLVVLVLLRIKLCQIARSLDQGYPIYNVQTDNISMQYITCRVTQTISHIKAWSIELDYFERIFPFFIGRDTSLLYVIRAVDAVYILFGFPITLQKFALKLDHRISVWLL